MIKIFIFAVMMNVFSISAQALPGGLPNFAEGIFLQNSLERLVSFLQTENAEKIFSNDFDRMQLRELADHIHFEMVDQELVDQFKNPRCLLNSKKVNLIEVSSRPQCLALLRSESIELYSVLLHELLNLLGKELPIENVGSQYSISKKLLQVPLAMLYSSQQYVLHQNCELRYIDAIETLPVLSDTAVSILKQKGYEYKGAWWSQTKLGTIPNPLIMETMTYNHHRTSVPGRWNSTLDGRVNVYGKDTSHPYVMANQRFNVKIKATYYRDSGQINERALINKEAILQQTVLGFPQCIRIPLL